ncbi:hypothetical protein EI42_05137 [Thermosporothrix hazakensis]|jgi:hypothetical protein|uniref:Uncharacterized protein n=2 Tax=Thermosporothrix TaxID=768650 RepID=A0A326U155_THEHA|nr:hypothetical protein [Thermosporothrix hazakensis]PZW23339.1 hypothetical protein EI42_05137 [Thermosporothrix hazakensis]BBH89548.1 hypothetical protein KTC_42990 [Thermosporothrix sp. COM3]GCE47734.1 hypothetical protein KTH_26030 [Thermosporothrix hazakensis]
MNLNEQFEEFLARLGVEMERPEESYYSSGDTTPEVSIFQASRDHYGVFYRLDIVEQKPELRVMVPVDRGDIKVEIYLVRLSERMPLNAYFRDLTVYTGSAAYERNREAALQHMLYAVAEMMKQLFWQGDMQTLSFPEEIDVYPLLVNDEVQKKSRKKR